METTTQKVPPASKAIPCLQEEKKVRRQSSTLSSLNKFLNEMKTESEIDTTIEPTPSKLMERYSFKGFKNKFMERKEINKKIKDEKKRKLKLYSPSLSDFSWLIDTIKIDENETIVDCLKDLEEGKLISQWGNFTVNNSQQQNVKRSKMNKSEMKMEMEFRILEGFKKRAKKGIERQG